MAVIQRSTLVSAAGLMCVEQAGPHSYKVMRSGDVDKYVAHLSLGELRDLVEVAQDLLAYLDDTAEQPLEQAS
jgi:hypothetical protein